jgi:hypothetical protein
MHSVCAATVARVHSTQLCWPNTMPCSCPAGGVHVLGDAITLSATVAWVHNTQVVALPNGLVHVMCSCPAGGLHLLGDAISMLGAPLIPCLFLVLGANLAEGPGAAQVGAPATAASVCLVCPKDGCSCTVAKPAPGAGSKPG